MNPLTPYVIKSEDVTGIRELHGWHVGLKDLIGFKILMIAREHTCRLEVGVMLFDKYELSISIAKLS